MKNLPTSNRLLLSVLKVTLATSIVFLAGCGAMLTPASSAPAPSGSGGTITGKVHGGQSPIYNAVVRLYSAGTSGYGQGSTLLATSVNTDVNGTFAFVKLGTTGGVINSALPTWQCPLTGNPQIYITAIGGNTQGTGVTSTNNASSALIAALGPCSSVTSLTQANINEISTVATVFALAQYINPGTTPGTETIGTSSTEQGTTGINNAVSSITNLANIATGAAVASTPYAGTGTASGATVTATPESAKLITVADILASCINTVNNASNNCVDLMASAAPPPVASVTSQPSATFGAAQDTIQAAYYMAVNPIDAGTFTSCNNGGATKLGCLFGLASSNPPFAGTLSAAPTDWTIGVTYAATGNCTNGFPLLLGPNKAAIDVNGNLWFVGGGSTNANWGELSPTGTPLNCGGGNANGRGLTIDPTGNVWVSFNTTTLANSIQEVRADNGSVVSWTPTATPYSIVSDGNGNIFSVNTAAGASLYQFAAPGTNYSAFSPTLFVGGIYPASTATNVGYIGADSQGRIFMTSSSIASGGVGEVYPGSASVNATITGYTATTSVVTFTTSSAPAFTTSQSVTISGLTTTNGLLYNGNRAVTAVTGTGFSIAYSPGTAATATTDNGSAVSFSVNRSVIATVPANTNYGAAIDSSSNVFSGTTCCSSGTATTFRNDVKTSPDNVGGGTSVDTASYFAGNIGMRSTVLDGAGNQWFGNELPATAGGVYSVGELAWNGTTPIALSTSGSNPGTCTTTGCPAGGGFQKADILESNDIEIDPSGNVWVMNTGTGSSIVYTGTTVTEIVGAAVPVVTPLSVGAKNNNLATKP